MKEKHYTHTVTFSEKNSKEAKNKIEEFLKLGRKAYVDIKTGKIYDTLEDFFKENPDYLK